MLFINIIKKLDCLSEFFNISYIFLGRLLYILYYKYVIYVFECIVYFVLYFVLYIIYVVVGFNICFL